MSIPNSGAVVGLIGLPGSIPFLLSQVTIKVLDNEGHLVQETVSNKQGFYFLHQIPAGSYTLLFEHENYLPVSKSVTIPPLSIQSINVELQPRTSLVTGVVTREITNQPITDVTILIRNGIIPISRLTTDQNGKFEVQLPVGDYNVDCYKPGYFRQSAEVSLVENEITEIDIQMQAASGIAIGVVTYKSENSTIPKPLENVEVQLIADEQIVASTRTNTIGLYIFNDLELDLNSNNNTTEYILKFNKDGYQTKTYPLKLTHLFSTSVSIQNINLEKNAP